MTSPVAERPVTDEAVSQWGVVGRRGPLRGGETWHDHMPARKILRLVGPEVWNGYFKFGVIRNPFSKVVSHFWFKIKLEASGSPLEATDRRFRRMGHVKLATLLLKTALNSWNQNYFLRDHHYWQSEA